MERLLADAKFDFVSREDKAFLIAWDQALDQLGYTNGGDIGSGYCWGKYMVIYTKRGVKSKKSYARAYLREDGLVLRLYFSNIDEHRSAVESAPAHLQEAFTGSFPQCDHCREVCSHRKRYALHGAPYEACDGKTFWFCQPNIEDLPDYLNLCQAFYPAKKARKKA